MSLLGTLVVILSLAVLLAIVATLRYTKSAVLNAEKKRLAETSRNLAQEYEDRADSALRKNQETPLDNSNTGSSREELLSLTSRLVLQNLEGIGGGFYFLRADKLVRSFYPSGEVPAVGAENGDIRRLNIKAVIEVARSAVTTGRSL